MITSGAGEPEPQKSPPLMPDSLSRLAIEGLEPGSLVEVFVLF